MGVAGQRSPWGGQPRSTQDNGHPVWCWRVERKDTALLTLCQQERHHWLLLPLTDRLSPQVHSKDKKYVCKLCSRVFMSAASVGIKHGSRRHGVCADCAGRGAAGSLDSVEAAGSPELFSSDGPYLEDPDDPRGDGEEELGEDEDDGLAHEDALLGEDKEDEDSPRGPHSPLGSAGKDFAWIS